MGWSPEGRQSTSMALQMLCWNPGMSRLSDYNEGA